MIHGNYDRGYLREPEDDDRPDVFDKADLAYERERDEALLDEHIEQIEMERKHPGLCG